MSLFLRQHKQLVVLWMLFVAAVLAAHFYYVHPLRKQAAGLAVQIRAQTRHIRGAGWATNRGRLTRLLDRQKDELRVLERRVDEVWRRIDRTFDDELQPFGGDINRLIRRVSRLDFAEAYSRILYELTSSGKWRLAPEVLGLSEHKASETVYEMLLQLWVLAKVVRLADEQGLAPVSESVVTVRRSADGTPVVDPATGAVQWEDEHIAQISCLPVRAYSLPGQIEKPFLLEIPIHLEATCSPAQLQAFMMALADPDSGSFLAMERLELFLLPSTVEKAESRLRITTRIVAFARLSGSPPREDQDDNGEDRIEEGKILL